MAKAAYKSRAKRLDEAISVVGEGMEAIGELRDEITEWKSNMEGTNLEQTGKYERLETCESALSELCDNLESVISEANGVEFPTMFD